MKHSIASLLFVLMSASSCTSSPETAPDPGEDVVLDTPDPFQGTDPCVDLDQCDIDPPGTGGSGGAGGASGGAGGASGGAGGSGGMGGTSTGSTTAAPPSGYVAGAHLLLKTYGYMRKEPKADGAKVTGIAPEGGVHDSLHVWENPAGLIPPAQKVTLVDPVKTNGYYQVKYDGKTGWVGGSKLVLLDPDADPIAFALDEKHRNIFFKHQIHRTLWNKDGPSSSGNCAPTSLAMAARILGKEPAGLSIEESIHRVRKTYESPMDEHSGTTRSELLGAAEKIGLSVHEMSTDHADLDDALAALKTQLDKKRLVALEGYPAVKDKPATTYKKAMDAAYAAAIAAGQTLYHAKYEVYVHHSILVMGRDGDGHYVVGDPMSEVGFVALTPAQMKDYMARWPGHRGTGISVWVP